MIVVDMPMPERCESCPLSYLVKTGPCEGRMICNAMEYRDAFKIAEVQKPYNPVEYVIDDYPNKKPDKCPIIREIGGLKLL